MSSDGLVEMDGDSNSKISIMDVIVWYRCGTCHGYFHSIPILRYHYLVDHKSSMPRINGQLPPGALKGKIYTRHKPPPPPIRNVEPTSAPIPITSSPRPLEEIVVDVACNQPAENPIPSPSDSGIHDGDSETHEEELQPTARNIVPATPPRQNVVSPPLLQLTDKTDNVTSKEKTATLNTLNTQHDVAQESSSKCTICQKKFQTLSALNFHLKKRHMYQVVSGSSENNHAETSPPKLILKMTKNSATATSASSTAPIETTTNSADCIVAGRRRSSRLMSSESCTAAPHSGDAGSPSTLHIEALTEAGGGESNMDSVNTETCNQKDASVGDIADTGSPNDNSKHDAEVNGLSDSSTSTVVRPKKKINGSFVSASSDSSNWDIEKGPTKKKLLTTSDSEQSVYQCALSSPPRSPQTYAAEENRDKDDTAQREGEPDNVLTKPDENNATHTGDKEDESPSVEMGKKRLSQPTEGLQNSSNTNEDQSNRKRKRRRGKASGQINKDDSTSDSDDDEKPLRSRKIKRKKKLVSRSQISSSSESEEERGKETAMHQGHDDVQNEPFSPCPPALSCYGGSDNEVPQPSVTAELEKKKAISSHDSSSSSDLFIEVEVKKKKKKTVACKPLHMCTICHVECQSSSDLVHHLKKVHDENCKLVCGFCQKLYRRKDMFNKHMRLHKNGKKT